MAYCTLTDIRSMLSDHELIQLTDDAVPPVTISQTNIDAAIGRAGDLIDGYLRGRYVLPLSPVPGIITNLALDITVYYLFKRRKKGQFPETVATDYKNALDVLKDIQAGKVDIGSAKITTIDATGGVSSGGSGMVSAPGRIFSRDTLGGF